MFMDVAGETEGTAKADIEAKVNAYFDRSDANKDGVLSREEFDKFCAIIDGMSTVLGVGGSAKSMTSTVQLKPGRSAPTPEPEQWQSIEQFRRFDFNKDAKLDVAEATKLITAAVEGMGLTTDWVTTKFVTDQARCRTRRLARPPRTAADPATPWCASLRPAHRAPAPRRSLGSIRTATRRR